MPVLLSPTLPAARKLPSSVHTHTARGRWSAGTPEHPAPLGWPGFGLAPSWPGDRGELDPHFQALSLLTSGNTHGFENFLAKYQLCRC